MTVVLPVKNARSYPSMGEPTVELAKAAYIYGYPLVYNLTEVISMSTRPKTGMGSPVNLFGHADKLGGPSDRFVSVNNDTLYSVVQCDVTAEPLVLHLPDTGDRYYVMQFIDAWTNNFAYLGRRSSGTQEGRFLLAGPTWNGDAPSDMTLIQAPTNVFTVLGRFAVSGAADVPAVAALQSETWLTPLSQYPNRPETSDRRLGDWDLAPWDERVPDDLHFWEQFRSWLARFPPSPADQPFVQSLAPLGVLATESPYVAADPALADLLQAGKKAAQEEIETVGRSGLVKPVNGWLSALHSFDYNLDFHGPGTIDSPDWKISDRQTSYLVRAIAARQGLWGNHGYEATYAGVFVDDRGEQLTGANRYAIHFDRTPPVNAFWSITMYDIPDYYLVANPINRYSIGDRTPGVRTNADGSLDIVIQHASPGADAESNWLPCPAGDFRPLMRMYQPQDDVLSGRYEIPPIKRLA
jgi:hypothetical protein